MSQITIKLNHSGLKEFGNGHSFSRLLVHGSKVTKTLDESIPVSGL